MHTTGESLPGLVHACRRASWHLTILATLLALLLLAGCGGDDTGSDGGGTATPTPTVTRGSDTNPPPASDPTAGSPSANGTLAPDPERVLCDNGVHAFSVSIPAGWEAVEGDPELRCRLIGPGPLTDGITEEPLFTGYSIWIRGRDASEQAEDLAEALRTGSFGAIGPPPLVAETAATVAGLPATRLAFERGYVFYVVDVVGPVILGATSEGSETLDGMVGGMVIGTLDQPTPSGPSADCTGGWVTPERGTDLRTEPLDALRARYGVTGLFVIDEMRYFEGPQDPGTIAPRYDYLRFWYVKASQQDDPSFRARWLLVAPPDGEPAVAATAPYGSTGFGPGDWVAFFGESDAPYEYPGLPGQYFGIAYDFVTGIIIDSGEPEGGPPGLPAESIGCLRGT